MAHRSFYSFWSLPSLLLVSMAGCGGSHSSPDRQEGSSGQTAVGGGTMTEPQGGATSHSGGSSSEASGGSANTGGSVASGGSVAGTGGAAGNGGGMGTGGTTPATGGSGAGAGGVETASGGSQVGAAGVEAATGGRSPGSGGRSSSSGGRSSASGGSSVGTGGVSVGGSSDVGTGGAGTGGSGGAGGTPEEAPVCTLPDASEFEPNPRIGGGGSDYDESDHFLLFGSDSSAKVFPFMEAAHQCFVEDWCWRSPGLSVKSDDGPYYKFNIYAIAGLSAGGYMQYDAAAGISYIQVLAGNEASPSVTVHEFGHALTLTEYGWVDQTNTGYWWESVANFVADTFITSPICEPARSEFAVASGASLIELGTTIGNAQWAICMNQNYYQAWPFLTYLTNNPDNYPGLGLMTLPNLFRNHKGNNETPLHVLERLASPVTVQTILGRYWARMAYLDIEHPQAQQAFFSARGRLNFKNLSSVGAGSYQVLDTRRPQYGGANIIPLDVTGDGAVSIAVTNLGNGRSESNFTATLSIRAGSGSVRYVDLPGGTGSATIGADEEASLVVVNTPDTLYMYDPSKIGTSETSDPAGVGLDYQVQITGAAPTDV
ncbi:MAG: hypothetical protein JW940_03325 [Polyangiaceae bacterium]|nr:hypothetical protein [Polyangiaceae bacterium]